MKERDEAEPGATKAEPMFVDSSLMEDSLPIHLGGVTSSTPPPLEHIVINDDGVFLTNLKWANDGEKSGGASNPERIKEEL